jgi:hypothetical protein
MLTQLDASDDLTWNLAEKRCQAVTATLGRGAELSALFCLVCCGDTQHMNRLDQIDWP